MKKVAAFVSDYTLDAVFTSTLSRSIQSGKIVAYQQDLDIISDHAFDEVSFGVWEGLSYDEIRRQYPQEQALWIEDPSAYPPPEGESFDNAQKRSMARLDEVLSAYKDRTVAVVARKTKSHLKMVFPDSTIFYLSRPTQMFFFIFPE